MLERCNLNLAIQLTSFFRITKRIHLPNINCSQDKISYFVLGYIEQMGLQRSLDCNYKSDCDWLHDIWRFDHKRLDKDQHIVYLHKTYLENILNLSYIPVDNLVVHQYNLVDTNKLLGYQFHDKYWMDHKEMVDKEIVVRYAQL